jgi:hypothetical protein
MYKMENCPQPAAHKHHFLILATDANKLPQFSETESPNEVPPQFLALK